MSMISQSHSSDRHLEYTTRLRCCQGHHPSQCASRLRHPVRHHPLSRSYSSTLYPHTSHINLASLVQGSFSVCRSIFFLDGRSDHADMAFWEALYVLRISPFTTTLMYQPTLDGERRRSITSLHQQQKDASWFTSTFLRTATVPRVYTAI